MEKRNYRKEKRMSELYLIMEMLIRRAAIAADEIALGDGNPTPEQLTLAAGEIQALAAKLKECQIEFAELSWEDHDPVCKARPEGVCT